MPKNYFEKASQKDRKKLMHEVSRSEHVVEVKTDKFEKPFEWGVTDANATKNSFSSNQKYNSFKSNFHSKNDNHSADIALPMLSSATLTKENVYPKQSKKYQNWNSRQPWKHESSWQNMNTDCLWENSKSLNHSATHEQMSTYHEYSQPSEVCNVETFEKIGRGLSDDLNLILNCNSIKHGTINEYEVENVESFEDNSRVLDTFEREEEKISEKFTSEIPSADENFRLSKCTLEQICLALKKTKNKNKTLQDLLVETHNTERKFKFFKNYDVFFQKIERCFDYSLRAKTIAYINQEVQKNLKNLNRKKLISGNCLEKSGELRKKCVEVFCKKFCSFTENDFSKIVDYYQSQNSIINYLKNNTEIQKIFSEISETEIYQVKFRVYIEDSRSYKTGNISLSEYKSIKSYLRKIAEKLINQGF